ncbi:MAG: shikimate dehydrogenase [Capsulimonadaceae bacterium]
MANDTGVETVSTPEGWRVTGRTKIVGVWGHPVAHSRSPAMHNAALRELGLDWIYVPFDVAPEKVADAVRAVRGLDMVGVNVTVPLKERVIAGLDFVDEAAARIASVNTIHNDGGVLRGYSTDGPGFMRSLSALGWRSTGRIVCLLGAGGSARAVAFALADRGNRVLIVNRTPQRANNLAEEINTRYPETAVAIDWGTGATARDADLLINTTSIGMHPHEQECPELCEGVLRPGVQVYDLIYAPVETVLLNRARLAGCDVSNGLGMLVHQGALALSIWTGISVEDLPISAMDRAARQPAA